MSFGFEFPYQNKHRNFFIIFLNIFLKSHIKTLLAGITSKICPGRSDLGADLNVKNKQR
jgi:hypothetical protein